MTNLLTTKGRPLLLSSDFQAQEVACMEAMLPVDPAANPYTLSVVSSLPSPKQVPRPTSGRVPIHIPSANARTIDKLCSQAFEHEQDWPTRDKFELLKSSEGVVTHRLTWAQREKLRNESST